MYTGETYASHTTNTITITFVRFANRLYVEPAAWELKSALLFIEIQLFCNWCKKEIGKVASNFILPCFVSLNMSTTYLSCTYLYMYTSTTVQVCIVSVLRKTKNILSIFLLKHWANKWASNSLIDPYPAFINSNNDQSNENYPYKHLLVNRIL